MGQERPQMADHDDNPPNSKSPQKPQPTPALDQGMLDEIKKRKTLMKDALLGIDLHAVQELARDAQRLKSVYGPDIAEHAQFLTEYRANLELFSSTGLSPASFERADLLARIAMPSEQVVGFDDYDQTNVEQVQNYYESVLSELGADFDHEGNPVFAWEALAIAHRYEIAPPDWVQGYLSGSANRILKIRDEVAGGMPVKREALQVAQALGFGVGGAGNSGCFKHATMLQRDRTIYLEVRKRLDAGSKLDFAYDDVAKMLNVSRSTIVRAFLRFTKLSG
jgi:hypothetical protein